MAGSAGSVKGADFGCFVPRLVADWAAEDPDELHRRIPGSMVFTDLSGFTAMSEKLASLGKVGAEELTHHLDTVFTELLEVAGGYGASLLKFGGDALLLFLWGEQHELRAAAAAAQMQARLAEVGRIKTAAGQIRLTMTVGAHAGEFDFFLVGQSHRELLVSGPAASRTVALEASAQSGQVIVSGAISAAVRKVDRGAAGPRRGRGVLLERAPRGVQIDEVVEGHWPDRLDPAGYVPALLRDEISGGVVLPEHRQMAVGFCHLANVDALLSSEGPMATAEALEDLVTLIQHTFAEHGVGFVSSDVYDDGPKIICSTGAIRSWENDDERLLRALREVLDIDTPIALRAGVHRGHGFRGPIGPPWRRTFAVMGDVVNTAARVMAKASPGELLSTQAPLDRSDTLFITEELPPFAAKGKAQPLVALRVGEVTGTREPVADRRIPLLGRDRELGELRDGVTSAIAGDGRAVELVGEAGMGKTRLIDELVATYEVVPFVRVQCGPYSQATPYFPFRVLMADVVGGWTAEALRTTVDEHAPDLAKWMPYFGVLMGLDLPPTPETEAVDPQFARAQLQRTVAELVERLVTAPKVWLVEDLHWADEASLELLDTLIPKLESRPLALVLTSRAESELAVGRRITVEPLDRDSAGALISAASPRPLLPHQVEVLAERAAGNPLFLHELASALGDEVELDEVPDSVEAVIAARLDALPGTDRRLVRELAVLGATTHRDTARAVVEDVPEPDDRVRWQRLEPFVHPAGDRLQFRHALVRDVAYGGLSFKERKAVHLAAGRFLETLPEPDQHAALLAQHFHHGGDPQRALRYSTTAAEQAEAAFAYESAAQFWCWAAEAARGSTSATLSEGDLLSRRGDALRLSGEFEQSIKAFTRARRLSPDQLERATLAGKLVATANLVGDSSALNRWSARALADLRRCDERGGRFGVQAELEVERSINWFQRGNFRRALDHAESALSACVESVEPKVRTRCLVQRYRCLSRLDDPRSAQAGKEAERAARRTGYKRAEAIVLSSRAQTLFDSGHWGDARDHFERAISLYEVSGDTMNLAITRGNLAELLLEQGEATSAVQQLRSARGTLEAGGTWVQHTVAAYLGWALVRSANLEAGVAVLRCAIAELDRLEIHDDLIRARVWLARALLDCGEPDEAEALLSSAMVSDHCPRALAHRVEAQLMVATGQPRAAVSALRKATESAHRRGEAHEWARATLELHALSPQPDMQVEQAYATLDRLGIPYEREEAPAS